MKKILSLILMMVLATPLCADQNLVLENQKSEEVRQEALGNYGDLSREPSAPLGSIQHAWDNASEEAGVYVVHFNPYKTIRLTLREYMTTTVIFPAWETIKTIEIGDKGNYQIIQPEENKNIVIIKPSGFVGLDTDITMIGESGHVYGFYVRTEGHNSKHISDILVRVMASKPFSTHQHSFTDVSERTDYLEEATLESSHLNFKFSMSGDKTIAPNCIYSDGVRTWFVYGETLNKKQIPTFYHVIEDHLQAINVTLDPTDETRLIAHASGKFILKSGERQTCIQPTE